jgi:hypothetical protein
VRRISVRPGAREGQDVVDQRAHAHAGGLDLVHVAARALVDLGAEAVAQQADEAVDVAQWRAQVVRDRVAEGLELAVERFQLRGARVHAGFELFVESADLFLGALAHRDVAQRAGEHALFAEHELRHRELQREGRAVLAAADQLALAADQALDAGAQVALDLVVLAREGVGDQELDGRARDLVRRVTEQAQRGRIHALDLARCVQREDAVDSTVDHGAQARLAVAQLVSRRACAW